MKKYLFSFSFLLFIININVLAQTTNRTSYIDIPSARFNKGLFINLDGSYPIGAADDASFDINGGLQFGLDQFNIGFKWYSGADFALDLSYLIMQESGNTPGLAIGIDNLTYRKYISPIGHDTIDAFADELYNARAPEVASAYLIATKSFGDMFEMTAGLGRGRFIGYGPRSHLLNMDVFFDEYHENVIIGIFGGLKFSIPAGASFIIETDGRDANIGLQYEAGLFKGILSLNKLELFTSDDTRRKPRIGAGFSIKAYSFEGPKPGRINVILVDNETGDPIPGNIIYENGEKKSYDIPYSGKKILTLKPGIYQLTLSSPDYNSKKAKIPIKAGQNLNFTVKLSKKLTPNMKSSLELTRKAAEHYREGRLKEARKELETALKLYPENKKAEKGMELVVSAIEDTVSVLKNKASSLERTNLSGAIALWEDILEWEPSTETENHIESLRDRLSSIRAQQRRKTTPARKTTTQKKKLTSSQISNLYKRGIKEYIQGNYQKAVNYFRQILNSDPNHKGANRYLKKAKEKL